MVQTVHDPHQIRMGDGSKIPILWDKLSDQSIHVFVRTSFPDGIGMGNLLNGEYRYL
jgi:hypothetical protein